MGKTKKDTEVVTLPEIYKDYPQLQKYNVADLAIAQMDAEYSNLKISDLKDAAGYKSVTTAISVVKSKRLEVEKVRKDLKADSLNYGRIVDAEAKRIQALIEPIESRLQSEKDRIDNEKEQIKLEKERKLQEILDSRKQRLFDIGMIFDITGNLVYKDTTVTLQKLQLIDDDTFAEVVSVLESRVNADQEAKAMEEAEQEKKRLELIAEAERLEKIKLEQAEAQAKIDEENRKIQSEKDRLQREKEMEEFKAKAEAEAKANAEKIANAKIQEELRIEREKKDAEIERLKAEAEARFKAERLAEVEARFKAEKLEEEQRQKEQASDKDKLSAYIENLNAVPVPNMKSLKMRQIMQDVTNLVKKIEDYVITHTGGKR